MNKSKKAVNPDLLKLGHVVYPEAGERRDEDYHAKQKHRRALMLKRKAERQALLEPHVPVLKPKRHEHVKLTLQEIREELDAS